MSSGDHTQRPGTLVQPRRALVILGALGFGAVLGRVVDLLDYVSPVSYGVAAIAAACGLTAPMHWLKAESEYAEDDVIG